MLAFCSNDYLGLARHPLLIERACEWTEAHGTGSGASRLVTGTSEAHLALEAKIAAFKGTEAALLFVAAQAGFLGGPAVLSNMALDRWLPGQFSLLSERLVIKNGILLLDHAEHAAVASPVDALLDAARVRLRPILMTTLATAAGLLPLALGLGGGAKVQQPLAVAVIGGLGFALLFSIALAGGIYLLGPRRTASSSNE